MTNTIQKSLLQSLRTDHEELFQEIADVEQFWTEVDELGGGPKYEEMASRVHHLRERIRRHFADEERGGYLATALAVDPELAPKVEGLKQQHQAFLDRLDRFSQQLQNREVAYHNWNEVHAEFEEFLKQLHDHESAEMAILRETASS